MQTLLEVRNLTTQYFTDNGVVKAVDDVSFALEKGEAMGIVGESGCGKSTLGHSLMRLVPKPGRIVKGEILLEGTNIMGFPEDKMRKEVRWKRVSMVFQNALNALNPVKTVGDQITDAILSHEEATKQAAWEKAAWLMEAVGVNPSRLKNYPHEFSGGMKQRVVIAMALGLDPDVLIADEPTTALDVIVQAQILNLLKRLRKEMGLQILLITHDLSLVAEVADKVAVMYAGRVVEIGPADQIYGNPSHPYTQALMKSVPRIGGSKELYSISGTPPNLITPPSGCMFHPRCPYVMDVCRKEDPGYRKVGPMHYAACWLREKEA